MTVSAQSQSVSKDVTVLELGDANEDGSVTSGDATLVLRKVVGLPV